MKIEAVSTIMLILQTEETIAFKEENKAWRDGIFSSVSVTAFGIKQIFVCPN